jgi:hypothetical protein
MVKEGGKDRKRVKSARLLCVCVCVRACLRLYIRKMKLFQWLCGNYIPVVIPCLYEVGD